MVEQVFVHRTEGDLAADTDCGAAGAVTTASDLLRGWRPDGHALADLEGFARDLEGLRCAVVAAAARNRAEITRLTTPAPNREDAGRGGGDSGRAEDGSGFDPPPGPTPGGRGDHSGGDRHESRRKRDEARVSQILPLAIDALAAGAMTQAHITILAIACDKDPIRARRDEATLVGWARRYGPNRLRQMILSWCRFGEDPVDRDAEQTRKRRLTVDKSRPDAMVTIEILARTADSAEFLAAVDALADEAFRAEHGGRPESRDQITTTHAQRRYDAAIELARRATGTPTTGTEPVKGTKRRRPTITVICDLDTLRNQLGIDVPAGGGNRSRSETPDGNVLTPTELRRLACDAGVIPAVLGSDGEVLDLGRTARTPTPAQWDALVARDQCCTHPSCDAPPEWCDAHHIVHWADGGPTDLINLTLLCRRHHTALHNGEIVLTGTAPNLQWHEPANGPPRTTGPPGPPA
ncbi:MAG: DUF222 domain-containing protein [Acidimicrobiales bacterium]